jgi:hypothetical protein
MKDKNTSIDKTIYNLKHDLLTIAASIEPNDPIAYKNFYTIKTNKIMNLIYDQLTLKFTMNNA